MKEFLEGPRTGFSRFLVLFSTTILLWCMYSYDKISVHGFWSWTHGCRVDIPATVPERPTYGFVSCPGPDRKDALILERARQFAREIEPEYTVRVGLKPQEIVTVSLKTPSPRLSPFIPLPLLGIDSLGVYWPYADQVWYNPRFDHDGPPIKSIHTMVQERFPDVYDLYAKYFWSDTMNCTVSIPWLHSRRGIRFLDFPTQPVDRPHTKRFRFELGNDQVQELSVDDTNRCVLDLIVHTNDRLSTSKWRT